MSSLCLTISYARTPVATEAFNESISPFIGIDAIKSHFSFTSLLTPHGLRYQLQDQ